MSRAAIVLCGGRSRRMGEDKASLPFGSETLLARVVRVVSPVVDSVVIVAREGQQLPVLPAPCVVARDAAQGLGPLAGLAAGLRAISADRAFLTACDVPHLLPAYVERLFELAEGHAVAVPRIDGHLMVTSAVYARELGPLAQQLVDAGRLRPRDLLDQVDQVGQGDHGDQGNDLRIIEADELRGCDPELQSVRDCNTPESYAAALRFAGL